MNGILIVNKPAGWTSFDVVAKVRRLTKARRVGHAGTLDPMATGVLVICLGHAVRMVEYLIGHDKAYRATLLLGVETDTYDAGGQVIATRPVEVSETALREALLSFVGNIEQIPPMYSAIKHEGKKLYKLARQGIEVERAPRKVTLHSLNLIAFDPPRLTVDVRCSSGTYIRSLAHDLGAQLGCGAHLAALTRTAVGDFGLSQAATIEELEAAAANGAWAHLLRPIDAAVQDLPAYALSEAETRRARHGMPISLGGDSRAPSERGAQDGRRLSAPGGPASLADDLVRVYDPSGQMIGLMKYDRALNELRPEKIFGSSESALKTGTPANAD